MTSFSVSSNDNTSLFVSRESSNNLVYFWYLFSMSGYKYNNNFSQSVPGMLSLNIVLTLDRRQYFPGRYEKAVIIVLASVALKNYKPNPSKTKRKPSENICHIMFSNKTIEVIKLLLYLITPKQKYSLVTNKYNFTTPTNVYDLTAPIRT